MKAALFALIVAGCATAMPQPNVTSGIREVPVNKSVLETCVFEDEVPKRPGTWMNEIQTNDQRRAAKAADDSAMEAYLLPIGWAHSLRLGSSVEIEE